MRGRALLKIHGAKDDVCVPVDETEAVVHAIQAEQTALREATATAAAAAPAATATGGSCAEEASDFQHKLQQQQQYLLQQHAVEGEEAVPNPAEAEAPMSIPDVRLTLFETSPAPGSFASCAWMDGHDCWSEAYEVRACFLAIRVLTCLSLYYLVSAYPEYLV